MPEVLFARSRNRRVQLVAQAVVEHQARRDLPRVLSKEGEGVPVDGCSADVLAPGKVGGRNHHGIDKWASAQQAGERIRERVANGNIVHSALRGNIHRRICLSSTEVILPIRADAEVGGVAIEADFASSFECMLAGGDGKVLAQLEKIAVDADDCAGRLIEWFVGAVIELDRGIGEIGGGKGRSGAGDADGRLPCQPWGDDSRVGQHQVALVIDVANAKRGIDHRLIGVGGGAVQVVVVESGKELGSIGDAMVEAQRKLVRIGHHGRGTGISVNPVGARRIVGQRIAREHAGDARINRHGENIAREGSGVQAGAFLLGGHGKHLGGAQHLAKALVLAEVKGLPGAVVDAG